MSIFDKVIDGDRLRRFQEATAVKRTFRVEILIETTDPSIKEEAAAEDYVIDAITTKGKKTVVSDIYLKEVDAESDEPSDLLEKVSALVHEEWMSWAKDILKTEAISEERAKRWNDECFKPYEELSEEMKEYDREWGRKFLKILQRAVEPEETDITESDKVTEIPPRPLINPHATAIQQDKQLIRQQAWDRKYGKRYASELEPKPLADAAKARRREILQARLKRGENIGPKVLAEFEGEKWADEALAKLTKPTPAVESRIDEENNDSLETPPSLRHVDLRKRRFTKR